MWQQAATPRLSWPMTLQVLPLCLCSNLRHALCRLCDGLCNQTYLTDSHADLSVHKPISQLHNFSLASTCNRLVSSSCKHGTASGQRQFGSCRVFACGADISSSMPLSLMNASCVQAWVFSDAAKEEQIHLVGCLECKGIHRHT